MKRTSEMKKRRLGIGLVERAVLLKKWSDFAVSSQINMLLGDCAPTLVNYAGRMVYVGLGCAAFMHIATDDSDVRILRGAANALYDQVGQDEIENRQALFAGVEASLRVAQRVGSKVLVDEICKMEVRLRTEHLNFSDFQELC